MAYPKPCEYVEFPEDLAPQLIITVDVEEEFDWSKPFSRNETSVTNIQQLWRVQEVFDRYGVIPTYMIDYPVATTPSAIKVIRDIFEDGRCEIGTQLHPWVNPPFDEEVCTHNSFPGNLSADLERQKLAILTEAIEKNFAHRPTIYRAGRYGFGKATAGILQDLGYGADISVLPHVGFASQGGPDFRKHNSQPFWFGDEGSLLEIPVSSEFSGLLAKHGPVLHPNISSPVAEQLKLPAIAARLGLLNRIRLSPEGISLADLKRLTHQLVRLDRRIFQFCFHSSTLLPGATSYVATQTQQQNFITKIENFIQHCEIQGIETGTKLSRLISDIK